MNKPEKIASADLSEPLTYPAEAFTSREYAEAEAEKLWSKVWQQAGRVEELPEVGSYITYNIVHDSILIVRVAEGDGPDAIRALRHRPVVDSPTASSRPCSLSLARKTHVGPLPLTIAPRAP